MMRYPLLTMSCCVALAGCNAAPGTPADNASAIAAVKAAEAGMLAAFRAHDAQRVASFYTSDAEIMVPFGGVMRGSDVAKSTAENFKDPAFSIAFDNSRTEVSGEMAFTHGSFRTTYTNPATGKPATIAGSYLTVFRKQTDGSWKAVQDISTPGSAAKPPQDAPAAGND